MVLVSTNSILFVEFRAIKFVNYFLSIPIKPHVNPVKSDPRADIDRRIVNEFPNLAGKNSAEQIPIFRIEKYAALVSSKQFGKLHATLFSVIPGMANRQLPRPVSAA